MSSSNLNDENEFIDITIPLPYGEILGRWYGNRKVRPILALHGWLDNMGTWNTLVPLLPKHIGVLCIDLPGHGLSSKLPKGIVYNSVDFVLIIIKIMDAYKWKKVSLLAHSLSAMHSYIFTAICPDRVDMLITIDILRSRYRKPAEQIEYLRRNYDKFLVEDERFGKLSDCEPPSYTYEELIKVMYEGSSKSVSKENCKHILERNVAKSTQYPDKYYFSRDGRVKWYIEFITSDEFTIELAKRMYNIPYCVVKGSYSNFIGKDSDTVKDLLMENNPNFEFHEIEGTHHVHLNNPAEVAAVINPFINKHRPPSIDSWSIVDIVEDNTEDTKAQSRWNTKRRKRKSNL